MKWIAIALAVLFLVLAPLYWNGSLQLGATHPGPHHSHAVLCVILAIAALVWFRFAASGATAPRAR
ncbi:MAG: hypothetical protein ACREM2_06285 [Vulcanimicrobiaceae bacterium]